MRPEEIEKRSMEIILAELGARAGSKRALAQYGESEIPVVLRAIHTTGDFDFADTMRFSKNAVALGRAALKNGAPVVTDTNMALAGVSKPSAKRFGNELVCKMADEDIARAAEKAGSTRAEAAINFCAKHYPDAIYAIGNAPTALIRLVELVKNGVMRPKLVVGAPVGFVNVIESKEMMLTLSDTPYIIASGRKGGSAVAAAIINALYNGIGSADTD